MLREMLIIESKRLHHLELLRLLAIFLVIFNHTGSAGFTLFFEGFGSPMSFVYLAASIFCKIAVPIFFMISGALLLKKDESIRQLLFKRVFRMIVVLVLISVPFYYWLQRENGLGLGDFFRFIYSESASTSLWYLYSYIALLLVLPFLRSMVKNLKEKDYIYLFWGHLIFVGVLPCFQSLMWGADASLHSDFSPMLFMSQNLFFALMGHFLENVLCDTRFNKKNILMGAAFSVFAVVTTVFMTFWLLRSDAVTDPNQAERYFNCFIAIPALTVYFTVKHLSARISSKKLIKWINRLGSGVFGVYLIEKFLRAILSPVYDFLSPMAGSFIASIAWCFAVLLVGLIVVVSLKSIPGVKRIVNKFI